MPLKTSGFATIKNLATGAVENIPADSLDWGEEGYDERGMGAEIEHAAEFELDDGSSVTWSIWEYPEGVENDRETNVPEGYELLQNLTFEVYTL